MRRLPNILTILRVFLTVGFVYFLSQSGLNSILAAIILFVLASLSDYFDGYLAKKNNFVTNFGKIMDPIADKFLILAAFFMFMQMHLVAAWMFYAILLREFVVTGSRFVAMKKGFVLAAESAGKVKTVLQIAAVLVILFYILFHEARLVSRGSYYIWGSYINIIMGVTVFLTLFSGISALWNSRKILFY